VSFVGEATQTISFLGIQPDRYGPSLDGEDVADLVDGVTLVAEQDAMGSTTQGRLFALHVSIVQGLEVGVGKRRRKFHE